MSVFETPLWITSAPNGAYKQRMDHPALPMTPAELARTARDCLDAGASMLHLHVRDAQGRHSLDADTYRDATAAVRQAVGQELVIQVTSEAARVYEASAQMAMVRAVRPEAVSIGLREFDTPAVGEVELGRFFTWLAQERIMTQVILYDVADLQRWRTLCGSGLIPDAPWSLLFVLGRYSAGQTSSPRDLLPFVQAHSGKERWAMCAFGAAEQACATLATVLGGHVRLGFENNLYLNNGEPAPDNAALIRQMARTAESLARPLARADTLREWFGR